MRPAHQKLRAIDNYAIVNIAGPRSGLIRKELSESLKISLAALDDDSAAQNDLGDTIL